MPESFHRWDGEEQLVGREVIYVPTHARVNCEPYGEPVAGHPDIERGVVRGGGAVVLFVRYGESIQTQATDPRDIFIVETFMDELAEIR